MRSSLWSIVALGIMAGPALAQEFPIGGPVYSGNEPLYSYDDLDVWKHGWMQIMPYYGGYHTFRPYNYKQVLSQSAQAAAWGMPHSMPYSQQYYHRYENFTGGEFNAYSLQSSPHGPHPSALHQPQWNTLRQSPLINAGYDHRQGAAYPQSAAPVNFENIHRSPAAGPESQRMSQQNAQLQQLLQQASQRQQPTFYEPIPAPAASVE